MNNLDMRHLEDGQLLRYLDGELTRRKARHVREHLEACWQCRTELEGLQAAVADCVRYRKNVLGTCLAPPPEPWKDLSLGFDRIDSALVGESLAGRLLRALTPRLNWVAAFASLAMIAGIAFHQLREAPSVQAAALLKRALAVSEIRPHAWRRVRIMTRTGQMTRVIGTGSAPKPAAAGGMEPARELELEQMFRSARYGWDDPLSAKSYTQWRDHLAAKEDSVNTVEDRQAPDRNTYEIKTTTQDGDLVAATLKLRMTDFEPIEGRFEFRNRDWVEMTELVDQQTLPASTIAGTTGGMPRQPGMPPAFIAPSSQAIPSAGWSAELQVVEALHQVGADLGDPVEIGREGRRVLVSGTGIPPERQEQLHALLDPLPNVVLRFADATLPAGPKFPASATPVQTEPAPARDAGGPEHRQLQARIEERLGGRPQFERFSGQLLDWTDSAMARAYALRRLAQEFGPAGERQMISGDRRALRALGREHLAAFAREAARIEAALRPVLTALPVIPPADARGSDRSFPPDAAAWQPAAEELLSTARGMEALLAVVLGVAPGDRADNAPEQLMAVLSRLTTNIEQCQRLLSYDDVKPGK
jgi:hypothetical protein